MPLYRVTKQPNTGEKITFFLFSVFHTSVTSDTEDCKVRFGLSVPNIINKDIAIFLMGQWTGTYNIVI